jgi:hypothetical protein
MKYTDLSLAETSDAIRAISEDARMTFGTLDERHLNWKPDEGQWSIAQCFEHLVISDRLLVDAAKSAIVNPPTSVWQRLPAWPAMFGKLLAGSQGPREPKSRKYVANPLARPTSSVRADIIARFVDQHRQIETWTRTLDEETARRAILISPFVKVITYSVLDGLRLLVAHDRRHFEQARRVMGAQPSALPPAR